MTTAEEHWLNSTAFLIECLLYSVLQFGAVSYLRMSKESNAWTYM